MASKFTYIYTVSTDSNGEPFMSFDRSIPSHLERNVKERIEELKKRGIQAVYTVGKLLTGAYF